MQNELHHLVIKTSELLTNYPSTIKNSQRQKDIYIYIMFTTKLYSGDS